METEESDEKEMGRE